MKATFKHIDFVLLAELLETSTYIHPGMITHAQALFISLYYPHLITTKFSPNKILKMLKEEHESLYDKIFI